MTAFAIATEDALSEAVTETLLQQVGICDTQTHIRKAGFGYLRSETGYPVAEGDPPHQSDSGTTANFIALCTPTGVVIRRQNTSRV